MTGTHNHIDRLQLARLIGDNPDLLARLAAAFLRQLPVWLADFELHSQACDTERMAKLLHKMKGSCLPSRPTGDTGASCAAPSNA